MSRQPFFLTSGNAKIRINGKTIAYATGVNYRVTVNHIPAKTLGQYEYDFLEPVSYIVTGSFNIIRYTRDASSAIGGPNGVSNNGNGIGNWGGINNGGFNLLDGRPDESFNPGSLAAASTIEIEIWQKMPDGTQLGVARVREARITESSFSLNMGTPSSQSFSFTARYLDEDSFLAGFSGITGSGFTAGSNGQ